MSAHRMPTTRRELIALIETHGRPKIDLRMFNVQRAVLDFPDGVQIRVTPFDECFAHVVRLAAAQSNQ